MGTDQDASEPYTLAQPVQPTTDGGIAHHGMAGSPGPVRVVGVRCPAGHFDDPRRSTCRVCGAALVVGADSLVEDVRPAAGVLRFSDGVEHVIECTVVIGRQPDHDPGVEAGMALGLALDDEALMLSRVHAELAVVGWDLAVIDRSSVNGTFVRGPGTAWQQLEAEVPTILEPGTELRFGAVEASFDAQ